MVGPRKQPFALHRHIVIKIPFLRDRFLMSTDSIESRTGSMTMSEVDTMAFAAAVDFAYSGRFDEDSIKLKYAKPDDDEDDEETPEEESDVVVLNSVRRQNTEDPKPDDDKLEDDKDGEKETEEDEDSILPTYDNLLVSVFDLAQALQYEDLANATIDQYVKVLASDPPSAWALTYLQRKGLENSKMMHLMLRAIAYCIHSEGYEAWEDHSFMKGWVNENVGNSGMVMRAMAEFRDEGNVFEDGGVGMDVCGEYHCHGVTERCVRREGKRERQVVGKVAAKARGKRLKRV